MKPVKRPASQQKCPTCGTTLEHEPSIAMQQELDDAVERGQFEYYRCQKGHGQFQLMPDGQLRIIKIGNR